MMLRSGISASVLALLFLVIAMTMLLWQPAWADTDRQVSREREALRRAQMQLQQVQGQVSSLEQEKAQLGKERDQAVRDAGAAQSRLRRTRNSLAEAKTRGEQLARELEGLKQELATATTRLADSEGQLAETTRTLMQTQQSLARTEADKRGLEGIRLRHEREIALCEDKNAKLYQTGRSLMTRFEQKTCGEILAQQEPLFGFRRVEVENLLEEYRDKLDEQRLIKPPGG